MEQYNLPFKQKSSLKWYFSALFLFSIAASTAGTILFLFFMIKDDFIMGLLFGLFMLGLTLFFTYIYIFAGMLKRFYIEMTPEYLKVSLPFRNKLVYWREIYQAQVYESNNNTLVAILLEKDISKKRKRTIANNFNSLIGIPPNSFQISLTFFSSIDSNRLLSTIGQQINKFDTYDEVNVENRYKDNSEVANNIAKAMIISSLVCITMILIYGFTIYIAKKNYVAIPILGSFWIISAFNKYYLEESSNLYIRILLGAICLIQVPAAVIVATIISGRIFLSIHFVFIIVIDYFKYLLQNPLKQITIIIISIICFAIGVFKGRTRSKGNSKLDV